jgi:hypothetical protein
MMPNRKLEKVANSIIACAPHHSIWPDVFEDIIKNKNRHIFWLEKTGPPMFCRCVRRFIQGRPGDVQLLTRQYIITAAYLPGRYMRGYGIRHKGVCVLDFNDTGRRTIQETMDKLLRPLKFFKTRCG